MDTTEPTGSRPLPVTIVGWWLLVTGVFQILTFLSASNPILHRIWTDQGLNADLAIAWSVFAGLANGGAAIGILHGRRWGRTVYLVIGLLGIVAGAAVFGSTLAMSMFGVLVYGLFTFVLTRPDAEAYFTGSYEAPAPERQLRTALRSVRSTDRNTSDLQQVFGVIVATGAGFLFLMACYSVGLLPSEGLMAILLTGFFLVPAAIALALAVFLWGRRRWAGLVGWTVGAAGLWATLSGLSMMLAMDTEYWQAVSAELGSEMLFTRQGLVIISLSGVLALIAGIALVLRQRSRDASAVADELRSNREA